VPGETTVSIDGQIATDVEMMKLAEALLDPEVRELIAAKMT
jgi:hypothetical protein